MKRFLAFTWWLALLLPFGSVTNSAEWMPEARWPYADGWHRDAVGVQGGIPYYPTSSTLAAGSTPAQIQSALNACPTGQAIALAAGSYTIDSSINIPSQRVLRGAAMTTTTLNISGSAQITFTGTSGTLGSTTITGGKTVGSTALTVASTAAFDVGDWLLIHVPNSAVAELEERDGVTWTTYTCSMWVKLLSKTATVLTIDRPLRWVYSTMYVATASSPIKLAGLEDLTIDKSGTGGDHNLYAQWTEECWLLRVRSRDPVKWHFRLQTCAAWEVRQCWMDGFASTAGGGDSVYGVGLMARTGACLVEDNVAVNCRHAYITEWGGQENIFGYNYSRDPINESQLTTDFLMIDACHHGGDPRHTLWEGNQVAKIGPDDVLGSSRFNTYFRNWVELRGLGTVSQDTAFASIQYANVSNSVVNCVMGFPSRSGLDAYWQSEYAWKTVGELGYRGNGYVGDSPDSRVISSTFWHGVYAWGATPLLTNASGYATTFPNSLYYSSKPSWYGSYTWPPFGSDVSGYTNLLPAVGRYNGDTPPAPAPIMSITGNGLLVQTGDTTPSEADGTYYGTIEIGSSDTHTFYVVNSGDDTLNLTDTPIVALTGSGDFTVLTQPDAAIAAGSSSTFTVECAPSSTAAITATVSIANDSDQDPYTFTLGAAGQTPEPPPLAEINVTGKGYNIASGDTTPRAADGTAYGTLFTGEAVTNSFVVQNTGGGALAVSDVRLTRDLAAGSAVAFPGAEGYGAETTGGRGGAVVKVTNLNDSGAGSLRTALTTTGARTIVFTVSGTITLSSAINLGRTHSNFTLAGQTAPGDGICVAGSEIYMENTTNVIVRYVRFRHGVGSEEDSFSGINVESVILDHCSFSWGMDENCSVYNATNLTVQWCIISEGLYNAGHSSSPHSMGGIISGRTASIHHNLFAHNMARNPLFAPYAGYGLETVDIRNNVIYNWADDSLAECIASVAQNNTSLNVNIVNNWYQYGPATEDPLWILNADQATTVAWYVSGNYVAGDADLTANNWLTGTRRGIYPSRPPATWTPYTVADVTTHTATVARDLVLLDAGASRPLRDSVDARVVSEATGGTATYGGSYGAARGMIDTQATVGGWPTLTSRTAPTDTDSDGMPDWWEDLRGLDKTDASDRNGVSVTGYTNLEDYLNSLAESFWVETWPDASIAAAGESSMLIGFSPHLTNSVTTTVRIISDDADEAEYTFDLSGNAEDETPEPDPAPIILLLGNGYVIGNGDVTPATYDGTYFGTVAELTSVTNTFVITNYGTTNLTLTGSTYVVLTGDSAFAVDTDATTPIATNSSSSFTIVFTPPTAQSFTATVAITNDSTVTPYTFALAGEGLGTPVPNIAVSPTSVAFGLAITNVGTIDATITITNSGTASLTTVAAALSGTHAADYSITAAPAATVATNSSTTCTVRFAPTALDLRSASLDITSNDPDEPTLAVPLTGYGIPDNPIPQNPSGKFHLSGRVILSGKGSVK